MSRSFQSRTKNTRDDWQTPLEIVSALGPFDLDPCANVNQPTRCAPLAYTQNGLEQPWTGRVWMNPPYGGEPKLWLKKLAEHGNGVALVPPRVGSKWFHNVVLSACDAIFFLRGRVSFLSPDTGKKVDGNNADSILVAFGAENVRALQESGLPGVLWCVKNTQ
jgi:phage N-6-adenine-methyltransferase